MKSLPKKQGAESQAVPTLPMGPRELPRFLLFLTGNGSQS